MRAFLVRRPIDGDLCFDELHVHNCGLIQIHGWQRHCSTRPLSNLSLYVNGEPIPIFQIYRYERPDVPDALPSGLCLEADLGPQVVRSLELLWEDCSIFAAQNLQIECYEPHYHNLRRGEEVLARKDVYCFGPPNSNVHPEIAAIAVCLRPVVLDFGCGIGAMIRTLIANGIEARGIEIDRPAINEGLAAEMRPRVTLYDGSFPVPFGDKTFESVICSEVLEHIPQYETALGEMARICRGQVFITVPDMSTIPLLHKHSVVPWHLLEATHVNFFNQTSLEKLLKKYFRSVEFYRIGPCEINGTSYRESLAALCSVG